ncbi:MAG: hypothetical protein JKY81_01270 [Colwellia sp.]|nr:hypothetical protein [Colwellia sp.]
MAISDKPLWATGGLYILLLINHLWFGSNVYFYLIFLALLSLLVFIFKKQQALSKQISLNNSKSKEMPEVDNALIHEVVFELQQFLHQEINIIENELNRTKSLVEGAVTGISDSFKNLRSLSVGSTKLNEDIRNAINNTNEIIAKLCDSVEQIASADMTSTLEAKEKMSVMMSHVEKANQHIFLSVEALADLAPKINDAVALGVRSLQFEDLTRQSLESLQENVQSIHEISDVLISFEKHKQTPVHQQLIALKDKCQDVYYQTKLAENARSVKQMSMDEGEVDLF